MLRLPKIVTGAAAGAALLMLGIISGQAQGGPVGNTTRARRPLTTWAFVTINPLEVQITPDPTPVLAP